MDRIVEILPLLMFLIAIGSLIVAIVVAAKGSSKDTHTDGERDGMILTEIGYVKSGIDDIKKHQILQDERHMEMVERVTAVEQSAKQAHKRIDNIERRDDL